MFADQDLVSHEDYFRAWSTELEAQAGATSTETDEFQFSNFTLVPRARLLLCGEIPVSIGSRAFDLLVVLVRASGRLVSKDEIIRHVWPTTTVDESNLRFQVASLRRALGRDRDLVKTIPGRGYFFADEVGLSDHDIPCSADGLTPLSPAMAEPSSEALRRFFWSAGQLVAAYGSIEALLGALPPARTPA